MQRYLKIKIKSLAAEAVMIRSEERKVLGFARKCRGIQGHEAHLAKHSECYNGLRTHRTVDVRDESRAALLAYGFLRGRKRSQLEKYAPSSWLVDRATKLVIKYGSIPYQERKAQEEVFKLWCSEE